MVMIIIQLLFYFNNIIKFIIKWLHYIHSTLRLFCRLDFILKIYMFAFRCIRTLTFILTCWWMCNNWCFTSHFQILWLPLTICYTWTIVLVNWFRNTFIFFHKRRTYNQFFFIFLKIRIVEELFGKALL